MFRSVSTLACASSAIVLGVMLFTWPWSYLYSNQLNLEVPGASLVVTSWDGHLLSHAGYVTGPVEGENRLVWVNLSNRMVDLVPSDGKESWKFFRLGFGFDGRLRMPSRRRSNGSVSVRLSVPHWFVMLCSGVLPAMWMWRRGRRRRPGHPMCPTCGYDLVASPESCPECGETISDSISRDQGVDAPAR